MMPKVPKAVKKPAPTFKMKNAGKQMMAMSMMGKKPPMAKPMKMMGKKK